MTAMLSEWAVSASARLRFFPPQAVQYAPLAARQLDRFHIIPPLVYIVDLSYHIRSTMSTERGEAEGCAVYRSNRPAYGPGHGAGGFCAEPGLLYRG